MGTPSSRVSELAFKIIIWVFFGLAMVTATSRIVIRLLYQRRLRLDDYLLLLSCAFLTAATGVLYYGTSIIFLISEIAVNPAEVFKPGANQVEILRKVNLVSKINWTYLTLSWATIFWIKFGFLALFRQLVDRVARLYTFWKGVVVFTTLVFAFAICDGFIACPKQGITAAECSATPQALTKSLAIGVTMIVLDMVTDVLILAIPVWLLWRVRIKLSQKCGLAAFLCLNICMIIMAIVRVSGLHYHGAFDNAWIFMWQQVEACVAVTMLSLTSFRSLFVAPSRSADKARPWVPSTRRLLGKRKAAGASDRRLQDLTIPSATLTGLSGFVQRTGATTSTRESFASETWPLSTKSQPGLAGEV